MKNKFIEILYYLTAFLADKTKGFPLFSKWKIALGSLLVGITVASCSSRKTTCYVMVSDIPKNEKENDVSINNLPAKSDSIETELVFCYAMEEMPGFPRGEEAMLTFIYKNLQYPKVAKENAIEGIVHIQFIVTENGDINQIKVLRSPHPALNEEAIRIVKLMPKWIPGKQNGTNSAIHVNLPIKFKLK